jgi:hypothetical protein
MVVGADIALAGPLARHLSHCPNRRRALRGAPKRSAYGPRPDCSSPASRSGDRASA